MGHRRLGFTPNTKPWKEIVELLIDFEQGEVDVGVIASQTLKNVQSQFLKIGNDSGFEAAITYLVFLSISASEPDPIGFLFENGYTIGENLTPLDFAKSANKTIRDNLDSTEYNEIARQAISETISNWYETHSDNQTDLFSPQDDPLKVWSKSATGSGFCELTRLFFSNFTKRYLKYFLEREVSKHIHTLETRESFDKNFNLHVDKLSEYALGTSKIIQSYSAGWFNKKTRNEAPNRNEIKQYIRFSLKKIRSAFGEGLSNDDSYP